VHFRHYFKQALTELASRGTRAPRARAAPYGYASASFRGKNLDNLEVSENFCRL